MPRPENQPDWYGSRFKAHENTSGLPLLLNLSAAARISAPRITVSSHSIEPAYTQYIYHSKETASTSQSHRHLEEGEIRESLSTLRGAWSVGRHFWISGASLVFLFRI